MTSRELGTKMVWTGTEYGQQCVYGYGEITGHYADGGYKVQVCGVEKPIRVSKWDNPRGKDTRGWFRQMRSDETYETVELAQQESEAFIAAKQAAWAATKQAERERKEQARREADAKHELERVAFIEKFSPLWDAAPVISAGEFEARVVVLNSGQRDGQQVYTITVNANNDPWRGAWGDSDGRAYKCNASALGIDGSSSYSAGYGPDPLTAIFECIGAWVIL